MIPNRSIAIDLTHGYRTMHHSPSVSTSVYFADNLLLIPANFQPSYSLLGTYRYNLQAIKLPSLELMCRDVVGAVLLSGHEPRRKLISGFGPQTAVGGGQGTITGGDLHLVVNRR